MIQLLVATAHKTNTHMAQIFKDAYDYNEIRFSPEEMMEEYETCIVKNKLPEFVIDYCLQIWPNGSLPKDNTQGVNRTP